MMRFPNRAAVTGLGAVAVSTAAVSLVTLNGLKDAVIDASLHGRPVGLGLIRQALGPLDAVLVLLAAVCVLGMAWMEWRGRLYTVLMTGMTDAEFWTVGSIIVAWLGHCYLGAGILLGGDISTHIGRFLEVARGLDEGRLADWTNYQYMGAPLLWFTGPLTYVVGGAVTWVTRDAVLTMKLLLFVLHVLGGLAFMGLIRRLEFRPVPALVATAGFAGSFAHLHMFLYRGVMPQAFTMLFMVLVFWAADGLLRAPGAVARPGAGGVRGSRWLNAMVFALATAALIVNHQPHALFIGAYLGLFGIIMLMAGQWRWSGVPVLAVAGGLAAIASTLAVVPILLEADSTMIVPEGALFGVQLPTVSRLLNLVVWRNSITVLGFDYWAYLGLGLIVFGVVGIVALLAGKLTRARRSLAAAAFACLIVEFFLYNSVVRDVMFMLLFLSLLAAVGLEWLIERRSLAGGWLLAAVGLALLDLASTSVQPVLRTDKGFLMDAGRYLERTAPNERVAQAGEGPRGTVDIDMGPKGTALSYASVIQRIGGNHNMAATRIHNFSSATSKMAEAELQATGTISPKLRAMLGVFNVSKLICSTAIANGCPAGFKDTKDDPVLGRYVPIAASPAIFSRRLVQENLVPGVDKPMLWPVFYSLPWMAGFIRDIDATIARFIEIEQPDPATASARAIPVQQAVPVGAGAPDGPWTATVRSYAVSLDRVSMRIETDGTGWVQLSHPWFPSTVVTINGVAVQPLRGMIGLIVLPVEPGVSVIELREGGTTVRRVSMMVSLIGLLAILLGTVLLARHDRRKDHGAAAASSNR